MNLSEVKNIYSSLEQGFLLAIEDDDQKAVHDILTIIMEEVLTEENTRIDDPDIKKYQELASRIRSSIFSRFPTKEIPKVFLNDFAYALERDQESLFNDIRGYFMRFRVPEDFSRQQKTLVNYLLENKQRLTSEPILAEDDRKVISTVGNWIKYYYRKVGGDQVTSRIKTAEFFSKDRNVTKLISSDLEKIKKLIMIQELLRQPTEDLMKSLIDINFHLGNGVFVNYRGGEFFILDDGMDQLGGSDLETVFDSSDQRVQKTILDEDSKPVKSEVTPKRTELKPIASSEFRKPENPLDRITREENPKHLVSPAPHELVIAPSHELTVPAPTPKQDFSVGDFINREYTDSPDFEKRITQELGEMEMIFKTSPDSIALYFLKIIQSPEIYRLIAFLKLISRYNLWDGVTRDKEVLAFIKKYSESKGLKFVDGEMKKTVNCFVRAILEGLCGLTPNESARIAAQLVNDMHDIGVTSYFDIVYFDMVHKRFVWNE